MAEKKSTSGGALSVLVDDLQARGRYTFDRSEALSVLQVDALSLKKAAARLSARRRIVAPRRGFYVIVPLEYRVAGAPPPSWFIDSLMRHLGRPYYVGVLSAAALHGAGHQQPQEFQVVSDIPQRAALAGRARIRFLAKRSITQTPTVAMKTETGTMQVATPEATAIDLLRYASAAGGLSNIAGVLSELAERVDGRRLVDVAESDGELANLQRLGYLLDSIGTRDRASSLADWMKDRKSRAVPLKPGKPSKGCPVNRRWKVIVNEEIEVDL